VVDSRPARMVKGGGAPLVPGITFKNVLTAGRSSVSDVIPSLEVQPSEELLDSLKWSFVGELHNHMDVVEVRQRLVMEGLHQFKVTGMGENRMLLHMEGVADIDYVISHHKEWWDLMFKKVVRWSPQLVAGSRTVWLNVFGIPLHVWDEPLFKKLGELFGVFLDFDEDTIARKRLDYARVQISTDRKGIIDNMVNLTVMGADFILWVVEEGGGRWWLLELVVDVGDEGSSRASRVGDVVGGKGDPLSEDEDILRLVKNAAIGDFLDQPFVDTYMGTEEQRHVQEDSFKGDQSLGSPKWKDFLNDHIATGQVASMGKGEDVRREERDRCIRAEGRFDCSGSASGQHSREGDQQVPGLLTS